MSKGEHLARIMPLYNSDSHSRHQNICIEQPFLSHTMCNLIMSYIIDMSGLYLGYTKYKQHTTDAVDPLDKT